MFHVMNASPCIRPSTILMLTLFIGLPTFYSMNQGHAASPVEAKDIVAIQLRAQGMACSHPISAIKDKRDSQPDAPVWIIKCDEAIYRVRLIPHLGSRIQVINPHEIEDDIVEMKD